MPNRLAEESSPYLRQHADNPVDWWPWGEAAFAEARRLDRPVFVSIGYAACHWCHVMAHESFEDPEIARMMNALFVNVKVDREERPDVDAVYMNAILVMGEGGGWPLSAFCLPDGRPYFLGTYFPPKAKFGRPSFADLIAAMSEAFGTRRADCVDNAEQLADGLARLDDHYRKGAGAGAGGVGELAKSIVVSAGKQIAERCDAKLGGLAGHPKFPSSATHALLARAGRLPFGDAAQAAFDAWAKGMADGGIYDHVGGGFARYSVDDRWLVPHFEKMLYDQAQLLGIYAVTRGPRAREVIDETVAFLARELSDPAGGLWSSLDADSEGEEGKFYTWTMPQLRAALGPVDAMVFAAAYGATEGGNFEDANVLSRVTARSSAAEEEHLQELRAKLFAARAARVRPGTDDKVLAGWNGLAITGLLAANTPAACAMAIRVGEFLRAKMVQGDRLARVFHHGVTKDLDGTLEDYAFCARAFLDLAEATGDRAWWDLGAALAAQIRARFVGEIANGVIVFYLAPAGDALLVHRTESHHDAAIPSGAAIAVDTFVRLGTVAGDAAALTLAETYLAQRLVGAAADVRAVPALVSALDRYLHQQVVVVTEGAGASELRAAAVGPLAALAGPWAQPSILDGKSPSGDGAARAFVCTGPACSPPVATPAALHALLHPVHQ